MQTRNAISKIKFDTLLARWLVCFHCKGSTIKCGCGGMADAQRSGRCRSNPVEVQILSSAPKLHLTFITSPSARYTSEAQILMIGWFELCVSSLTMRESFLLRSSYRHTTRFSANSAARTTADILRPVDTRLELCSRFGQSLLSGTSAL